MKTQLKILKGFFRFIKELLLNVRRVYLVNLGTTHDEANDRSWSTKHHIDRKVS